MNSFSAWGGGTLNKNFPKIQMPGGLPGGLSGGMLKLRFDWYITASSYRVFLSDETKTSEGYAVGKLQLDM